MKHHHHDHHGHSHHDHHHHHHHTVDASSLNSIFIVSIVLNLLFVAVEAGVGLYKNSLGLLSDAGHNLSDVFSLVLALIAFKLAKLPANERYTYGYKKSTILISLLNAIILLVAVGAIIVESVRKIIEPTEIDGEAISIVAGIGILVNGLTAWLLMKNQKNDLNVRGAYLHMAADTLVSVGVVVSGVIISFTGWSIIDPLIGLAIAIVIVVSTWNLLSESLRLSLDGKPEGIDSHHIRSLFEQEPHVQGVHHIHIWAISTTENALTAHIVIDDLEYLEPTKQSLKSKLKEAGIKHATIETERIGAECACKTCEA